jgi:hypothetical protein
MSRQALVPVNVFASASAPSTPTLATGDLYYNLTAGLQVYTGTGWEAVGSNVFPTMADGGQPDSIAPYNGGYFNTVTTQVLEGGTP